MIADCGRGSNVGGLLRYLYGPGETNEHTSPRLVASWLGDDPAILARLEPGGEGVHGRDCAGLTAQLRFPVDTFGGPEQYVWHVPIAISADEGELTDAQWALAARRVLECTGVALPGDPAACRWVVVHHGRSAGGNDHVHLVATLVRQDGRTEKAWNDWPRSRAAVMEVEGELGLRPTPGRDRTADKAATRAETKKAARLGAAEPARSWLRREVRTAVAMSTGRADFEHRLMAAGVAVRWRTSTVDGAVTGYAVGRPDDVTPEGEQVWFGGSKLAPDLALNRLEAKWREGAPRAGRGGQPARGAVPAPRRPLTEAERHALLLRTARSLERAAKELELAGAPGRGRRGGTRLASPDAQAMPDGRTPLSVGQQAQAISAAEVASSLARVVEGEAGGPLTDASAHLARAARSPSGRRPDMQRRVHGLRGIAQAVALLGTATPGEAGEVLTIVAHLTRIADALERIGRPAAGAARALFEVHVHDWGSAAAVAQLHGQSAAAVNSRGGDAVAPGRAAPSRRPEPPGRPAAGQATGSPSRRRRPRG